MKQKLTNRQKQIYDFIHDQIVEHGISPSSADIKRKFNLRTSNGVMCHVNALERKGWIKRDRFCYRGIKLTGENVTQFAHLRLGQAVKIGGVYIGKCAHDSETGQTTLELIAPNTYGEVKQA